MNGQRLSGLALIQDMVHSCQERIIHYHRKGFEAEQQGEQEAAQRWYRLSTSENLLLQQYWQMGAGEVLKLMH